MPNPASTPPPALDFHLSGAVVRVTGEEVTVSRKARTRSAELGPVTAALSDAGGAATLIGPGTWTPGRVKFACGLPDVRVTPHTVAAAQALVTLLDAENKAEASAELAGAGIPGVEAVIPGTARREPEGDPDFFAFDVETANADEGSVIQFGIAAVRDGRVAETYSWPCRPPAGLEQFDEENTAVHGITPADVVDAPTFAETAERFGRLIDGTPVVAHNAKFDFTALKRGCAAAGIDVPDVAFACTLLWARRVGLQVEDYRLPTLAREAGAADFDHHDAAADAAACAKVALWLMRQHPGAEPTLNPVKYTENLGMEMGMLFGTRLVPMQTTGQSQVGGGSGRRRQARDRRAKWDAVKAPEVIPPRNEDADPDGLLYGQRVTLTGDFAPYDKGRLWELIAGAGADINKGVTKKTTILVAGPWDSVTSKEKRARELKEQGQDIDIWSEKQLFEVLGLTEEPPF